MTSHLQIKEQQQVEEIITLLKQTGDTGCFLFVTCAGPRARQTVEEAIREGLTRDTPVRTINLAAGERDLAARLRQELAVLKNSPPVYFIDGLPQVVSEEKAKGPGRLSHSLLQLNLSRDFFATKRLRLLLWLDEPTEQELFWKAGDLWAVRSGHWSFRHEADLKARITTEMEGRAPLFEAHDLRRRVEEDRELLYRYEKLRPDDRLGIAEARERLARSLIARGELEEAGSILTKSLGEIGEKNGSEWLAIRGESFLSLGHLHLLAGRFQESEAALRQSLAAFRRVGDSWGEANALRNLGVVQRRCGGDVVRAQAAVQKALTTFRRLGDPAGEAVTLADLGALYRVRGQLVHAEATLQDALAAFRRLGDPRGKASALGELAKVYRYRGELSRAEAALQETLATFHRVGDSWGEANALSELGIVYHDRGEFARAESMFDEALTIFRRVGDRCGEANVLGHLAAVHRDWGDLARAEAALKDAVAAFRGVGDSWGEARVLGDLALIHRDRGDYARAEAALKHTLATFRRFRDSWSEASVLEDLGVLYLHRGRLVRAGSALREALAKLRRLGDVRGEAITLKDLGLVYRERGDLPHAENSLQEALGTFRRLRDVLNEARTLHALAFVASDLRQDAEAERYRAEADRLFKVLGVPPPQEPVPSKISRRRKPTVSKRRKVKRGRAR